MRTLRFSSFTPTNNSTVSHLWQKEECYFCRAQSQQSSLWCTTRGLLISLQVALLQQDWFLEASATSCFLPWWEQTWDRAKQSRSSWLTLFASFLCGRHTWSNLPIWCLLNVYRIWLLKLCWGLSSQSWNSTQSFSWDFLHCGSLRVTISEFVKERVLIKFATTRVFHQLWNKAAATPSLGSF